MLSGHPGPGIKRSLKGDERLRLSPHISSLGASFLPSGNKEFLGVAKPCVAAGSSWPDVRPTAAETAVNVEQVGPEDADQDAAYDHLMLIFWCHDLC